MRHDAKQGSMSEKGERGAELSGRETMRQRFRNTFQIFFCKNFLRPYLRVKPWGEQPVDSQECILCKTELPIDQFEQYPSGKRRKNCSPCRMKHRSRRRHKVMGESHEAYLRNLHAKLKHTRKKTHPWTLDPEDLLRLWELQKGRCAVSGIALTHHLDGTGTKDFNASIDRINNDKGYSSDNVRLVAYRINIMRHTLSTDMFWWWIKTVHDYTCD